MFNVLVMKDLQISSFQAHLIVFSMSYLFNHGKKIRKPPLLTFVMFEMLKTSNK